MIEISPEQTSQDDRFSRFELISWWDQCRLSQARVLVVGAGALGNEIVKNCALVGIGNILVADMDRIENSNLSRSVLFRAADNGQFKAEVACRTAREIYPDICAEPLVANIVHDMGLGAYFWADVIIGGLDNREARVAINAGAAFADKVWIDGAIEVLDGVARVFDPGTGPCYECTMNATDWQILESRRSCALLTRDEMIQGRVPTTPTTASIIAAVQVQETIKILHGMQGMSGSGLIYSGLGGEPYMTAYKRKPDCYGHDMCHRLEPLGRGTDTMTVGELLERARADLGPDAVVGLSRDVVAALECVECGTRESLYVSVGHVTEKQAVCATCGQMRVPEMLTTLGLDHDCNDMTLAEVGVPALDVVTARCGDDMISYLFDVDAERVLGHLPHNIAFHPRQRQEPLQ